MEPNTSRGHRFAIAAYLGLFGFAVWYWFNPSFDDTPLTVLAMGMFSLGIIPFVRWVERNETRYPLVEVFLLATIPFYAIPVITESDVVMSFPIDVVRRSAATVLAFQAALFAGAMAASRVYEGRRRTSLWDEEIIPEANLRFTGHAMHLVTAYTIIAEFTTIVPNEWIGTFRAIFFGVGMIAVFLQSRFWGAGMLGTGEKILFSISLTIQVLVMFSSLLLVNGISILVIVGIGYFSTARKVPWLAVIILFPIIGTLHNGKSEMRALYWSPDRPRRDLVDIPSFYATWIEHGLQAHDKKNAGPDAEPATLGIMRRASLFQMVCIAVDVTPERRPYLQGDSYRNIAAQLVPRAIWPGKPKPADSVKLLAIQLGLQTQEAADVTSIGFGMLSEAYANFGIVAVVMLGFTLGLGLGVASIATMDAPTFSLAGAFRVLCLAWCFSCESPLVVWFSSLYQACTAMFVVLLAAKAFRL